jgi:hypothetical protein
MAAAIRTAGPNRARVRDALASSTEESADGPALMFDGAGNLLAKPQLVPVNSTAQPQNGGSSVKQ